MEGASNAFDDIANKYFERHFANSMISSTWNILFAPSFELLAHRFSYGIQFLRFGQANFHSCIAFIYRHFIYADYRILFEWPFYYIVTRFHRDKTPSFIRQKEKEKKEHSSPIRYTPFAVLFAARYFVYHVHINFCISSIFMPYQMILAFHYNPYVCHRIEQMYIYVSNVCVCRSFLRPPTSRITLMSCMIFAIVFIFVMFVCVLAIQSRFNLNRILSGSLLLPMPLSPLSMLLIW